jgi:NO-binding membrane sensor protein with MHYT domain
MLSVKSMHFFGIPEFQVQAMILFLQAERTCNSTSWQDQPHYS